MPERQVLQTPAILGMDYTDLSIETADGETLHGWWLPAPKSVGHILFAHGNGGNIGDRIALFALGIIGEYVARIHYRTMERPPYLIRANTGDDKDLA